MSGSRRQRAADRDVIRNSGFNARIEVENHRAWLGSLPGNYWANVRRPVMHTLNLSHLPAVDHLGRRTVNPCDKYPPNSPPLMMGDRGQHAVSRQLPCQRRVTRSSPGPTGTGKSTLLQLATQARRYPDATIVCFDKRYRVSFRIAVGGAHYGIAGDHNEIASRCLGRLKGEG